MNRTILTIVIIFIFTNILFAQRKTQELDKQKQDEQKNADATYGKNDSWKDKMIFGGNIGGSLGNASSFFMIQPIVGYKFTDKIQAGISPLYIYNSRTYIFQNKSLTQSISAYGPGIFGRYFINENIFAHTEYLGLKYNKKSEITNTESSHYSNSLFVGGGYMPGGGGSGIYMVALYDLLYNSSTSFYSNPLDIRVGFVF